MSLNSLRETATKEPIDYSSRTESSRCCNYLVKCLLRQYPVPCSTLGPLKIPRRGSNMPLKGHTAMLKASSKRKPRYLTLLSSSARMVIGRPRLDSGKTLIGQFEDPSNEVEVFDDEILIYFSRNCRSFSLPILRLSIFVIFRGLISAISFEN